ncbi:butyrophilin-like protein 2 isoform X2 [Myotis yumanensis]|uniref:butyrophilin-like protein 2 isoform X2 n=1 Tax=Myotis yumanensis TaxID=159337 RepID=UPI0038D3A8DC
MSHQHKPLISPCLGHLRRQKISTIYHGSLISLYLCFQMVIGAFQVQGPHDPLVAMLGGEAELPCFLSPPQRIKNMKITWTRSLPSRVVHLYEDGRDKPEEAVAEYLGRTELVKNVMHKGIVVLKILNVQPSDNGQYRCVIQHGSFYSDTMIELKVAALGSHPQFHVEVTRSGQLQLECTSEGCFPQPKVQWMDSEGREIPANSETHTQDKCGLFHVTTSLLLRETSQKNLTCSVWNPVLNQKKEEHFSITVAEPDSTTVNESMIRRVGIASAALLIILISTGLCLNIRLKNRAKNSLSPDSTRPDLLPLFSTEAVKTSATPNIAPARLSLP